MSALPNATALSESVTAILPVILSGGAGTRLWPLSRQLYPKQLLPLVTENSLLVDTALRTGTDQGFAPPLVVCNEEHRFIVAEQLRAAGNPAGTILLEPVGRNTAPAIAAACLVAVRAGDDPLVLVMPSDHAVANRPAFLEAVRAGTAAARDGALVTFGITPDRPETGYGYIKRAVPFAGAPGCFAIERFVEKPDAERAAQFLADRGYSWNSGMFLFKASRLLEELQRFEPDVLAECRRAVDGLDVQFDFTRLPKTAFMRCKSISIDHAVMERTGRAVVVPVDMGWSDVGSWSTLWEIGARDGNGNVIVGDVITEDTTTCYIRSTRPLVATIGVKDLAVIATDDAVLIAPRDRAQDVKHIASRLSGDKRREVETHTEVHRPWGSYESIDTGSRFQVKRITVNPGQRLSLQMHYHRAEHWVVVQGTAKVTRDDETIVLRENESVYIPIGARHRLENPGKLPLHLIEVQSGGYLEEDDIVRFDDDYKRG
jgi:mannose-1-phosphate guanylyltransferase/mannose-6-phosphate isomerase